MQAIECINMQTPFVLNIAGHELSIHAVSTHKAQTLYYGEIDKVTFHIIGNPLMDAVEFTGTSFVNAYHSKG